MNSAYNSNYGSSHFQSTNNYNNNNSGLSIQGKSMSPRTRPSTQSNNPRQNKSSKLQQPQNNIPPDHRNLTQLEQCEIGTYANHIYYCGQHCSRKHQTLDECDDSKGDYTILTGDHIAYRYEIQEVLGKGSFGQVIACFDHAAAAVNSSDNASRVAVKIIRNKKRFHQQALVEVKVLEHLKQCDGDDQFPIVKLHHSFYFRNHLCIVFPLLSMNLYEFIKSHEFAGFSLSIVRRMSLQIAQSLSLLYRERIIHCDLKPENILLVNPGKSAIRVIDFGSSCFVAEKVYTYIQSRFYRSPEIVLGLPYGTAIDMWSFGCILAELYTGYPIFPAQNEQELISCVIEVLGIPPLDVIMKASRRKLFFHSNYAPRQYTDSKGRTRRPSSRSLESILKCHSAHDASSHAAFVDFVRRCITWDPDFRMKPDEALNHPFISLETAALMRNTSASNCASLNSTAHKVGQSPVLPTSTKLPSVYSVSASSQSSAFVTAAAAAASNGYRSQQHFNSALPTESEARVQRATHSQSYIPSSAYTPAISIGTLAAASTGDSGSILKSAPLGGMVGSEGNNNNSHQYYKQLSSQRQFNNNHPENHHKPHQYFQPVQQNYSFHEGPADNLYHQHSTDNNGLLGSSSGGLKSNNGGGSWSSLIQGGFNKLLTGFKNTIQGTSSSSSSGGNYRTPETWQHNYSSNGKLAQNQPARHGGVTTGYKANGGGYALRNQVVSNVTANSRSASLKSTTYSQPRSLNSTTSAHSQLPRYGSNNSTSQHRMSAGTNSSDSINSYHSHIAANNVVGTANNMSAVTTLNPSSVKVKASSNPGNDDGAGFTSGSSLWNI